MAAKTAPTHPVALDAPHVPDSLKALADSEGVEYDGIDTLVAAARARQAEAVPGVNAAIEFAATQDFRGIDIRERVRRLTDEGYSPEASLAAAVRL